MDLTNFIPVILTIHVLIVLALIGVVLLQRSEGGALGMGGGGGGFMTGRGAANVLTRSTSVLAALFFATSLGLAIIADQGESQTQIIQDLTGAAPSTNTDGTIDSDSLIRSIGGSLGTSPTPAATPVESEQTPTPPQVEEIAPTDDPAAEEAPPATDPAEETPPADPQ